MNFHYSFRYCLGERPPCVCRWMFFPGKNRKRWQHGKTPATIHRVWSEPHRDTAVFYGFPEQSISGEPAARLQLVDEVYHIFVDENSLSGV